MKEWAKGFYQSKAWKRTRAAYYASQLGMCERCGKPGDIVHHKVHLSARNINSMSVALSFDNLELLCRDCHADEHQRKSAVQKDLKFDVSGNLVSEKKK